MEATKPAKPSVAVKRAYFASLVVQPSAPGAPVCFAYADSSLIRVPEKSTRFASGNTFAPAQLQKEKGICNIQNNLVSIDSPKWIRRVTCRALRAAVASRRPLSAV